LELTDTYRHFDTLIWQIPSVGAAVGVGSIVAAAQIENANGWNISIENIRGFVIFLGTALMIALTVTLYKHLIFSTASTPRPPPKPPFGLKPSAGSALLLSMTIMTGCMFGLVVTQLFGILLPILIGFTIGILAWIVLKCSINSVQKILDSKTSGTEIG
jgi:purine-cytosine permease-like protein